MVRVTSEKFYLLFYFFVFFDCITGYTSNGTKSSNCQILKFSETLQADCNDIAAIYKLKDWQAKQLTHLLITCKEPGYSSADRNNDKPKLSISHMPRLMFVYVSNCSEIRTIPPGTFHNKRNLLSLHLDNLPIESLPSKMFFNSPNVQEIYLSNLPKLTYMNPFTLSESGKSNIKSIFINYLNVTSAHLQPFLLAAYKSIRNISITNNYQKLIFNELYFRYFNLNSIQLIHNNIDNNQFLTHLKATMVSLEQNKLRSKFPIAQYNGLNVVTKTLILSHNRLNGIFPFLNNNNDSIKLHSAIEKLYIDNNFISAFHDNFGFYFPFLKELDVRNNKIKMLPLSFQKLQLHVSLFAGNLLFCGCEMNWALRLRKRSFNIECAAYLSKKYNDYVVIHKNIQLTQMTKLPCTVPELKMEFIKHKKIIKEIVATQKPNDEVMSLYRCEYVQIRCISKGDPMPKFFLSNPTGPTLPNGIMMPIINPITRVSKDIIISYNSLSDTNPSINYLSCYSLNSYGKKNITIRFTKINQSRSWYDRSSPVFRSYRCSSNSIYNLTKSYVIIFTYIMLYIFIH